MPHDAKGNLLKPGDKVMIPGILKEVYSEGDFCNCDVELEFSMPGYPGQKTTFSAINTKQVLKADDGL